MSNKRYIYRGNLHLQKSVFNDKSLPHLKDASINIKLDLFHFNSKINQYSEKKSPQV